MLGSRISRAGRAVAFVVAVVLLVYTVVSTSVYSIPPTELGLVSELPLAYWVGLVVLGCLWYACLKGSSRYRAGTLALTVSYLFIAPAIVKVPVWISESYYPYGESLLITSHGHLVVRDYAPFVSYQDWPVFLYLASSVKLVTGLPDSIILRFFPLLTISMYGMLTFLVLRLTLKSSFATFGAGLLLSSFFLRQQYFGPQGLAYVFFLLIVLITCRLTLDSEAKKGTLVALYLLMFPIITLTHALTSFMVLIVVVALYLGHVILKRKPPSIVAKLIVFSSVFLSAYNMFVAPGFLNLSVEKTSEFFGEIWEAGIWREGSRIPGSAAQRMSYLTSWSIVLLTGLIAFVCVCYLLYCIRARKQVDSAVFSAFSVTWLGLAVLFALTTVYGSNEAYQRAFMFGLLPLTYLCVRLLSKRPRILLLVLCILLFLNIPAQYGSDTYRLATDGVMTGTGFFVRSTAQNITCLYSFYPHIRYFDPLKYVEFLAIPGTLPFTSVPSAAAVQGTVSRAEYVIRSSLQHNYYMYFLRQDPFESVSFSTFTRVYDDESFCVFRHAEEASLP